MRHAGMGALLVFVIGTGGSAQDKEPRVVKNDELGIALTRPADEKWKIQEKGRWLPGPGVTHVIDPLNVDAFAEFLEPNTKWPDDGIEGIGKNLMSNYREKTKPKEKDKPADWKEFKVIKEEKKAKYPGPGSPTAYFIQAVITENDDTVKEIHEWIFLKNNNLYRVCVNGAKGEYTKKAKEVAAILGSLQIYKPNKK